jgi:HK97 family phage prohead protease
MPTFVLNDENHVNSYGFRIPTKGISLKRFKANPVMLDQHWNSTSAVLGRWKNIKVEDNGQLTAEDEFDTEDEAANKVKGKVDRGFIKGASIGVTFSRENMKLMPDGTYALTACELYEASIVAVPSNANSLRLYAAETGELIPDNEIKLTLSALQKTENFNNNKMEKLVLSAAVLVALGLQNADDVTAVQNAVTKLAADNTDLKTKLEAADKKLKDQAQLQAKTLVSTAIAEGRLTADLEAHFVTLATDNYEVAAKVIASMPAKKSLAAGLAGSGSASAGTTTEVKTAEDFSKLSLDKQLAWKEANPDAYKALFA